MLKVFESTTSACNHTTIFHHKPQQSNPSSPLLVFIPGNPGFIPYYTKYLTLIANDAPSELEILGISHDGFTQPEDSNIYTLNDQVKHKIEIMKAHLKDDKESKRDVYILGHSVGAWITQRIVDATPEINYKFVGFITPTIVDIHKSSKGSLLWYTTKTIPSFFKSAGFLSSIASYLPTSIIDTSLNCAIKTTDDFYEAKTITKQFILTPNFVKQSLALATEEMKVIQSDWQYQDLWFSKHEDLKKWFFFTSPDSWVSDATQRELVSFLNGFQNVAIDRDNYIHHSFCIGQSELFADITRRAFNRMLDE